MGRATFTRWTWQDDCTRPFPLLQSEKVIPWGFMFKKILIANRGEIACRVIKTARKMGIATVAVYSDADARALHVEMADEKVNIGPPQAAQSYLMIEKIIAACKATGGDARLRRTPAGRGA